MLAFVLHIEKNTNVQTTPSRSKQARFLFIQTGYKPKPNPNYATFNRVPLAKGHDLLPQLLVIL